MYKALVVAAMGTASFAASQYVYVPGDLNYASSLRDLSGHSVFIPSTTPSADIDPRTLRIDTSVANRGTNNGPRPPAPFRPFSLHSGQNPEVKEKWEQNDVFEKLTNFQDQSTFGYNPAFMSGNQLKHTFSLPNHDFSSLSLNSAFNSNSNTNVGERVGERVGLHFNDNLRSHDFSTLSTHSPSTFPSFSTDSTHSNVNHLTHTHSTFNNPHQPNIFNHQHSRNTFNNHHSNSYNTFNHNTHSFNTLNHPSHVNTFNTPTHFNTFNNHPQFTTFSGPPKPRIRLPPGFLKKPPNVNLSQAAFDKIAENVANDPSSLTPVMMEAMMGVSAPELPEGVEPPPAPPSLPSPGSGPPGLPEGPPGLSDGPPSPFPDPPELPEGPPGLGGGTPPSPFPDPPELPSGGPPGLPEGPPSPFPDPPELPEGPPGLGGGAPPSPFPEPPELPEFTPGRGPTSTSSSRRNCGCNSGGDHHDSHHDFDF